MMRCRPGNCVVSGMEWLTVSQDSIEDCGKLAGDGDDRELSGFSSVDEGFEEGFEAGCVAAGDEGGDIEGVAHALTAASDRALATPCAAVVVEWGETDQ